MFCRKEIEGPRANPRLQRADDLLEVAGGFVGGSAWRNCQRCADVHGDFAEAGQAAVFFFHLPDAVKAHGNDG